MKPRGVMRYKHSVYRAWAKKKLSTEGGGKTTSKFVFESEAKTQMRLARDEGWVIINCGNRGHVVKERERGEASTLR